MKNEWRDVKPEDVQQGDRIRIWCWESMDWITAGRMDRFGIECLRNSASPRREMQLQRLEREERG